MSSSNRDVTVSTISSSLKRSLSLPPSRQVSTVARPSRSGGSTTERLVLANPSTGRKMSRDSPHQPRALSRQQAKSMTPATSSLNSGDSDIKLTKIATRHLERRMSWR